MNTDTQADTAAEPLKVLAFDVFGTVVDWHSGIARAVDALGLAVDGDTFARLARWLQAGAGPSQ